MKKFFIILGATLIVALSMAACVNAIDENETTSWTEFIETYLPTIWTTTVETTVAETESILFDKDITFSSEYISNGKTMPYALYTPSTATCDDPIPLIVWLHGSGEKDSSKTKLFSRGLPKALNEWTLEGFNAYVLCPHLTGKWNSGSWNVSSAAKNLKSLLDSIINEYNIDTNQIIIAGCSLGGYGATYMAWKLPDYFSKLLVVSGYQCQVKLKEITIPAICFAGTVKAGEDKDCVEFMKGPFASAFGKENTFSRDTSHAKLPIVVFNEDKDGNNRSDVIEWMFENN